MNFAVSHGYISVWHVAHSWERFVEWRKRMGWLLWCVYATVHSLVLETLGATIPSPWLPQHMALLVLFRCIGLGICKPALLLIQSYQTIRHKSPCSFQCHAFPLLIHLPKLSSLLSFLATSYINVQIPLLVDLPHTVFNLHGCPLPSVSWCTAPESVSCYTSEKCFLSAFPSKLWTP